MRVQDIRCRARSGSAKKRFVDDVLQLRGNDRIDIGEDAKNVACR